MKKIFGPGLFVMAVVALLSCAQPKALVYQDVAAFRVHKADLSLVTIVVELRFFNPNKYSLSIKNGNLDATLNGRALGRAIIDERTVIPAQDAFLLPVTMEVPLSTLFQNALDALSNKEADIRLDGTVYAGKGGIFVKVPVHYAGKQRINL